MASIIPKKQKQKMRKNNVRSFKGKHHSEETKAKMSNKCRENMKAIKLLYSVYKNNNGAKKWNDFQKALHNGDITFEERPISIFL